MAKTAPFVHISLKSVHQKLQRGSLVITSKVPDAVNASGEDTFKTENEVVESFKTEAMDRFKLL